MRSLVLLLKYTCNAWLQHVGYLSYTIGSVNYFPTVLPFFGKLNILNVFRAGSVIISQGDHKPAKKYFLKERKKFGIT